MLVMLPPVPPPLIVDTHGVKGDSVSHQGSKLHEKYEYC